MRNKKAGTRILFFYWIIIMIMVSVAVVIGYNMFYSAKLDVRKVEAEILATKIMDCIARGGYFTGFIDDFITSDEKEDIEKKILQRCQLNLEDKNNIYEGKSQYYILIKFYDFDSCKEGNCEEELERKRIEIGRDDFLVLCELQEKDEEKENLPQCYRTRMYVLKKNKGKVVIEVLTSVAKMEQNV